MQSALMTTDSPLATRATVLATAHFERSSSRGLALLASEHQLLLWSEKHGWQHNTTILHCSNTCLAAEYATLRRDFTNTRVRSYINDQTKQLRLMRNCCLETRHSTRTIDKRAGKVQPTMNQMINSETYAF